MHKCCTLSPTQRPQRRINGLQFPLNILQIIGWIVFVVTGLLNFLLLTQIQFDELKTISLVIYSFLHIFHIFSHFAATLLDPGEEELRKSDINIIPEFDRSVHAHVIENGRCHLCNINATDKRTKHCGICNKCVYLFDHHCKWLNNCVGQRNYLVFILCVISALFIAVFTSVLCLIDMYFFFKSPQELSIVTQKFIMCTKTDNLNLLTEKYCKSSISFLIFLIIFCISALAIACALLHLLCFHIYISILGLSTYEYIVRNTHTKHSSFKWCRTNIRKLYIINHNKIKSNGDLERNKQNEPQKNNTDSTVKNFISTVVTEKLNKSKKTYFYDNNKIHPGKNEVS